MYKLSDLDKGQVYGDNVILGWGRDEDFFKVFTDSHELFGYWYFEDKKYLNKFNIGLYSGNKLDVYMNDKELSTQELYIIDTNALSIEEFDSNYHIAKGIKHIGTLGRRKHNLDYSSKVDNYLLKYKFVNSNSSFNLEVYSKKEIDIQLKNYLKDFARFNRLNAFILNSLVIKFLETVRENEHKKLRLKKNCDYCGINENYLYLPSLIRTEEGFGYITNVYTFWVFSNSDLYDLSSEYIFKRFTYYDVRKVKKKLPSSFKVIKDMNNINEVFENFLLAYVNSDDVYDII